MKRTLILMTGIFWAALAPAQKGLYTFDTLVSIPFKSLVHPGKLFYNLKATADPEKLIYIMKKEDSAAISHVYSMAFENYFIDSLPISNAGNFKLQNEYWLDFYKYGNKLYLLTELNIYEITCRNADAVISNAYPYKGAYRYLRPISGSTFLLAEMFNHGAAEGYKSRFTIFRPHRNSFLSYYPQIDLIPLTHYGNNRRISSANGKIYNIDLNSYTINETDSALRNSSTVIYRKINAWRYINGEDAAQLNMIGDNGYEVLDYIKRNSIRFSHLHHIDFLNDSCMLVGYTTYKSSDPVQFWAIWVYSKTDKSWKLKHADISDNITFKGRYTRSNYPLELTGNMFAVNSSRIVRITYSSGVSALGLSKKEFDKERDEYYEKNSARLVFTVFKHSFVQ